MFTLVSIVAPPLLAAGRERGFEKPSIAGRLGSARAQPSEPPGD